VGGREERRGEGKRREEERAGPTPIKGGESGQLGTGTRAVHTVRSETKKFQWWTVDVNSQ